MTQPIDTAYVDIVARDKSLTKLRKDIDKTFDDIDKGINKDLKSIDDHFDDLFEKIEGRFQDIERSIDGVFQEVVDVAASTARHIDSDFARTEVNVRRNFKRIADEADEAFDSVERKFTGPLRAAMTKIIDVFSEAGKILGQIGSGIGSFVSSSPLLVLILALTPAIIALAAALSQLIGVVALIPAGFAVALTAIIPVVVAFQNFGDAVSALAEGDVDKINEALKKLSPSAAAVAREIAGLLPQMRAFQRLVQEAFFSQIRGTLAATLREIFPTMEKGFVTVSGAMGRLVKSFAELAAQRTTIETFQNLFATTGRIIDKLNGPLSRFTDMLLNTVDRALPFIERLSVAFGKFLDKFSAWVNEKIETGEFDTFVEKAITTIKELLALLGAIGGLIGTIFAGTEGAGHDFLKTLTDLTIRLDEFLKTAEGQEVLVTLTTMVKILGAVLVGTLEVLIFSWQMLLRTLGLFETVGRGFVAFVEMIVEWAGIAKDSVVTNFDNMVNFITELPSTIMGLGPKFLAAGKNLIQSFMNGFRAVGSFVGDVAGDIVGAVKGFLNRAIDKINVGIARLDDFIPGDIGRIPKLAQGAFVPRRPGGILANIGEGNEDEWVLPQSKLDAIANGGGQTITFGPGSINLNFSGAMPTEQEARSVGSAVGEGIIDMLTRRNMRVQVRAV